MENKAKESQKNERDPLFSIEKTEFEKYFCCLYI